MRQTLMSDHDRNASVRDLAEALIVVLALSFLLGTLGGLETLTYVATSVLPEDETGSRVLWTSLYLLVVRAVVGIGLIHYRKGLAAALVPDGPLPSIASRDLVSVLLAAVGAFLFIPASARLVAGLVFEGPNEARVSEGIVVALSAALFVGSRGIARLWARLREID